MDPLAWKDVPEPQRLTKTSLYLEDFEHLSDMGEWRHLGIDSPESRGLLLRVERGALGCRYPLPVSGVRRTSSDQSIYVPCGEPVSELSRRWCRSHADQVETEHPKPVSIRRTPIDPEEIERRLLTKSWRAVYAAGYRSVEDVALATDETLLSERSMGPALLASLRRFLAERSLEDAAHEITGMLKWGRVMDARASTRDIEYAGWVGEFVPDMAGGY